jgi:Protein of unknown function (DUF4012)
MSNDATPAPAKARRPRRRVVLVVVGILVAVVAFVAIWVVVRALAARAELTAAVPLAHRIEAEAVTGKTAGMSAEVLALQKRADTAVGLTSDPIWRATEWVPWLGTNLVAVRQSAELVQDVARHGVPPLVKLATTVKVGDLVPRNGAIDLDVLATAAPSVRTARTALDSSAADAKRISTAGTFPQVSSAVTKLVTLVRTTAGTVDGIDVAVRLLPDMLGADGPRSYLLLSLNSAELRTPGGIPGAIAVVEANAGRLSLDAKTSATALGRLHQPVLPLSASEKTLYDERLGEYMQDVVSTPNFERSGQLAQAIWQAKKGQSVDGIVAIDPVALSYILRATGPIDVGNGLTLTSKNAVRTLLSTVYATIPDTTQQDVFFASVTRTIFDRLTSGKVNSSKMLDALAQSAQENRIHIWSAHPTEEKQLASSTLSGGLPVSTPTSTAFGVYLNDATGAKMDFYMRSAIAVSSAMCRSDSRPNFDVTVALTLKAPLDAATSLPTYVTGRYAFGVKPGRVRTNVYVYAPAGAQPFSVLVNGVQYAFVSATLDGHPVVGAAVEMGPMQTDTITFRFVGKAGAATAVTLQHTPMSSPVATSTTGSVDCGTLK